MWMVELRLGGRNAGRRKGLVFYSGERNILFEFYFANDDDDDDEYNF